MEKQGSFELKIEGYKDQQLDVNNVPKNAFHSFKGFVESLEDLSESSDFVFDLGTNRIAIKGSPDAISKLHKTIEDFQNNKLRKSDKSYRALDAIHSIISANGIVYTAKITTEKDTKDVTSVFKRPRAQETSVVKEKTKKEIGFKLYRGTIRGVLLDKVPNVIKFYISEKEAINLTCQPAQGYQIGPLIGQSAFILMHFSENDTGDVRKDFVDTFSEGEYEDFRTFLTDYEKLKGVPKLKLLYKFINQFVIRDEPARIIKFTRAITTIDKEVGVYRILVDVLKRVSDLPQIQDTYNELITEIGKKVGGPIY